MWLLSNDLGRGARPKGPPKGAGGLRPAMKRCALPRFLALAVLLQGADARKLGDSTGSSLLLSARTGAELSSLLRAPGSDQAYPMPVDLERLEASVLRLSNETQSSRQYLKPMIKSIRKMLQTDLVPDMSRQYGLAQKMLKDASKGFDACKDPWNATQVELLRSQHQKCREEENDLHNRVSITCEEAKCLAELKEKKCQELKGANTYPHEAPSVCDKESSDASYEAHAKRVRDFYKQKIEDWNNKEMGCANATKVATLASDACDSGNETWSEKRTSCTSIQRMLDTSACDAWTEHYRCSKQNTCLAEATAAYMNANTTATTMQKSISLQWRAMKRIECLLDALELSKGSDDVAKAIDSCRQKMHNATSWVLSYPYYKEWQPLMPTAAKVCGGEPTFPQPGTRSYEQVNYVGLPKNASADACSADCCTKCGYFKCNSTTVLKYGAKTLTGFSQEECCGLPPKIGWKYDKWETPVCPTACGHKEEMEERGVFCWDNTNNVHLDDSACNTTKPAVKRRKCPGTPTCGKCEEYTCGVYFTSKVLVPDKCKGHVCSSGECCNKVCAESDCPVGFALRSPTPLCDGVNCSQATCCSQTTWAYGAWSTAPMSCPTDCGHKVQTVNRSVTCQDTTGRVVCEDRCDKLKAVKPPNSRVVCPATRPCPAWIFTDWPHHNDDCCDKRECGLGQQIEERPVNCGDPSTGAHLADSYCKGPKPEKSRILCPSTPPCELTTTTASTTRVLPASGAKASCGSFKCPSGYAAKPSSASIGCTGDACEAKECCDLASWIYKSWNTTAGQECLSCGQKELTESRSVSCQVISTGATADRTTCQKPEPPSKRILCPATPDCKDCDSVKCGSGQKHVVPTPTCGTVGGVKCTREVCCAS